VAARGLLPGAAAALGVSGSILTGCGHRATETDVDRSVITLNQVRSLVETHKHMMSTGYANVRTFLDGSDVQARRPARDHRRPGGGGNAVTRGRAGHGVCAGVVRLRR
jgi:hypothetical protein